MKKYTDKIDLIIKLLNKEEHTKSIDLLKNLGLRIINDARKNRLSQKDICEIFAPLYKEILKHRKEKNIPSWVDDFMIEAVDMYISKQPMDVNGMENILIRNN